MKNFHEALLDSRSILRRNPEWVSRGWVDLEAELLLCAAYRQMTGVSLSRIQLFLQMQDPYPQKAWDYLLELSEQRAQGKILQHLTGFQVFLDHEYEVGPDVLVPRPETELLLEYASNTLSSMKYGPILGLEIGLGSGIISIELLSQFPQLKMIASELSPAARARGLTNAYKILGEDRLLLNPLTILPVQDPLEVFCPFEGEMLQLKADFLISNPPYLSSHDLVDSEVFNYEPHQALYAPEGDSLYFYRVIAEEAVKVLKSNAFVFIELPHNRALLIAELFEKRGWRVKIQKDLAGLDRILIARLGAWNG